MQKVPIFSLFFCRKGWVRPSNISSRLYIRSSNNEQPHSLNELDERCDLHDNKKGDLFNNPASVSGTRAGVYLPASWGVEPLHLPFLRRDPGHVERAFEISRVRLRVSNRACKQPKGRL